MKVQPQTNSPLETSGTKDTQAVKPSKDFEEVLRIILIIILQRLYFVM